MAYSRIHVSQHAVDRYIERIAPGMAGRRADVRKLIVRLVRSDAVVRPEPPEWLPVYDSATADAPNETVGVECWAVLVELGIAFPMRNGWVVTTLARAGLSPEVRARRNGRRSARSERRRRLQAQERAARHAPMAWASR